MQLSATDLAWWLRQGAQAWLVPGCSVCGAVNPQQEDCRAGICLCATCCQDPPSTTALPPKLPGLDQRYALWEYGGNVRRLIVQAKDMAHCAQAWSLLHFVEPHLRRLDLPKEALWCAPPPSRKRRLQDWYLPNFLMEQMSNRVPFRHRSLLRRTRGTLDQADLNGSERRQNLQGAFAAKREFRTRPAPPQVVLFDDVSTTGATMSEAGRALKAMGVEQVIGVSIAIVT